MTTKELRILAHTLGYRLEATSWDLEPYRNHYVAARGSASERYFKALIGQGFAEPMARPTFIADDMLVFRATPQGVQAVLSQMADLPRKVRIEIACESYP